ncbi:MAG TPA: phosphodiester glycosidase family protein [Ferruginibacter sp.]|nr:phosphodiester glycosidase family protein [Ferruginibacter sp.]
MLIRRASKIFTSAGLLLAVCFFMPSISFTQVKWVNVDSSFGPLPKDFHVYKTSSMLDGKAFVAYYAETRLKAKKLDFTTDTTYKRRLTPKQFYEKNDQPLLLVNTTFFSFATHQNLNVVIKDGKLVGYNIHTIPMRGKDTFQYRHPIGSAIGIDKNRNADIAWLLTDSAKRFAYGYQNVPRNLKDSIPTPAFRYLASQKWYFDAAHTKDKPIFKNHHLKKWQMKTAVGGGPVLLQNGQVLITNNEELKFAGKAINDKHPRTCMGYTKDGRLIIMVIQGRFPGIAEGASLTQEAQLLKDLGCVEALNLDGGGSSCMLINGKETITPSDKGQQRPIPAVFIIRRK